MRKAVRYVGADGAHRIGRLENERVVDAGPAGPRGFDASPRAWEAVERAHGQDHALGEIRLLAPTAPGTVLCIGSNYRDHIEETNAEVPAHPIVFTKLTSAIVGPGEPIVVPFDEPETDYEAELALVIGRPTRRVRGADARAAIGGVTAFNDISGRYAQLTTGLGQFTRGKSFDTFGPLGPAVVHPDDIDIDALPIQLVLSGATLQDSNTRHLLFGPEELVEWISAAATLDAGDVIATGTPGGVGHALVPPRYLVEGDVVEVRIGGIGTLRNPVVAESAPVGA
jgi:2-keto-4-pentenoate hydratase/2-oxohepta-3-ene-1,7-dioic acid hydratase in catechol pathway